MSKPNLDLLRSDRDEIEGRIEELDAQLMTMKARAAGLLVEHEQLCEAIDRTSDEVGRLERRLDDLNEDIPMERTWTPGVL